MTWGIDHSTLTKNLSEIELETEKKSSPTHLMTPTGLEVKLNKDNIEEETYGLLSLINMECIILVT